MKTGWNNWGVVGSEDTQPRGRGDAERRLERRLSVFPCLRVSASVILWLALAFGGAIIVRAKEKPMEAPAFSPQGGIYATNLSVQLSAGVGVIHYTLDGSDPGENSPVYSKPIPLTNSTLVRAR